MKIKRRVNLIGGDTQTSGDETCPDIFELDSGEFVVIGTDVSDRFREELQETGAGVMAKNERAVRIPRFILTSARTNIPNE